MEPAIKLTETKGRFPEGAKATRDRPVSAVLISRQVVPSTVEVENTESSSYRPNTASTNSTRPGTRLPSAAPRAITLTAVSHGWQSNDQIPSEFGEEEYKLARSGRSTPDIRSVEYGGSLPEVMSEGWFVQNMRREGVLAAASEPEAKLPSITAPVQDDGLPCASEPETTTCPSGAEGRDLSTPRKRKKVKKKHRKSRGRRKRDAQKQKMFDTFEDEATDIFGRSCQFEGTDVQNSGRSSRASRPGSSLPGSTAAPVVEDGNPDALEDVEVLEPALLSRPEKAVDEGMRLILQVKHFVGALQRAMRTHWMKVQHTLYMDMIYIVQRLFRSRRVHLQWLRVWALKRSGRSVTLALRQLERMDEAAHIPANGATTLRDLRKPCSWELDSPQSSSADLLAYKADLDPVLNRVRCIARRRLRAKDSMARHAILDVDRSSCLDEYSAKVARVSTLWPEWFELLKSAGVEGRTVGAAIQGEEAYAVLRTSKAEAVSPIPLSPLISYSALTPQSQQASISPTRNGSVSGRQSTTSASGKSKHDGRKSGSRKASRRTSELSSPHKNDRKSSLRNGTAPTRAATAPERTDTAKSSRRTSFAPGISKIDDPSQSKSLGSRRVSYALPADGVTGSRRGSSAAPAGQSRRSSFLRFLTIEETHLTIESILVTLEDV
ncbi:hypothetical protein HDU89_001336 [Geranomyces variabilis]|nr:hypothetical protein HDU89_001336 [Geranomyces variabilis]